MKTVLFDLSVLKRQLCFWSLYVFMNWDYDGENTDARSDMIHGLSDALLRRVYYPITAVVCMDEHEHIEHVELVDSLFALPDHRATAKAHRVYIIFSHPDGGMELAREEIGILRQTIAGARCGAVCVYIYGEDIGLCEVDREVVLGYNDPGNI